MGQEHISLSISPFLVIYANTSKSNKRSATSMQMKSKFSLQDLTYLDHSFAITWFIFANQIPFPISTSNTLVWANREISKSRIYQVPKTPPFPIINNSPP
jgi:hypothetical protein